MSHEKQFKEKELAKQNKAVKNDARNEIVEFEKLPEIEKLKYSLGRLENTIKLCRYDLTNTFKGNSAIIDKMERAKEMLEKTKRRIEELKNETKI